MKKTISLSLVAFFCLALTPATVNAQVIGNQPSSKNPTGDYKSQKKLSEKNAKKTRKAEKKQAKRIRKANAKALRDYKKKHPA